jgi:hypothetical protein
VRAGRDACLSASGRGVAQIAGIAVRQYHQARLTAAKKACLVPLAGDAWAAQDVGRWDATHGLYPEEVRDSRWAAGPDFLSATAELERPILPEHRDALESRLAQRPQDERLQVVGRQGPPAVRVQQAAQQRALRAHADESELLQAQWLWLRVQQALPLAAQRESLARPEQWSRALRARWASPPAWLERQAHLVSLRPAQRSTEEAPQVPQASSARPSRQLPSPLFLLWRLLPLVLLLRPRPESFCAPSPQRPRGSSSSVSSFP